ncbi:MFS transporter [Bacillus salitolerans]|uniref:MFS transporter n=1 Tax=Bacillus salitolerans TaxID=1437434 RepID=A0ABW4LSI2_9BACI
MPQPKIWTYSFSMLFSSKVTKVMAENITSIAFMWLLLESGGNAFSTSMMYVCSMVPQMLFGVLISPVLSKWKLTYWMFASDSVRAFIICTIPLLYLADALPLWMFYCAAFIQSACGAIYNPASVSLLPKVLAKSRIQQGNAILVSSDKTVYLLGLAGAGALITFLSTTTTLFITSALFLISALLILLVRLNGRDKVKEDHTLSYWKKIRAGITFVCTETFILPLALVCIFVNIGIIPWIILRPILIYDDLSASAFIYTLVSSCGFIGGLVVGIILTKVVIRHQGILFIIAVIVEGVALTITGMSPSIILMMICSFIIGMGETAINVPIMVMIQTSIPEDKQALVFSVIGLVVALPLPLFGLVMGPLALLVGNGVAIMLGGVLIILSGLGALKFTSLSKMLTSKRVQKEVGHGI